MQLEPGETALPRRGAYGLGITLMGLALAISDLIRDAKQLGTPFVMVVGSAALAGVVWLAATTLLSSVVVGHGYVRVRTALRTTTFRRAADPQALRVHSRGWVRARAGVLYLEQGGERAAVRLSPENQQRVLDALDVRPYDFHPGGQSIASVPADLRPALRLRHGRGVGIALAVALVLATFVWAFVVTT